MWLRFLRSLGSIIEYEANDINQQREDRPSRAVKVSWDLHRRACSRAAFCGGKGARQIKSAYAQLVEIISRIVAHKSCAMAHSKIRPVRWGPTGQNPILQDT